MQAFEIAAKGVDAKPGGGDDRHSQSNGGDGTPSRTLKQRGADIVHDRSIAGGPVRDATLVQGMRGLQLRAGGDQRAFSARPLSGFSNQVQPQIDVVLVALALLDRARPMPEQRLVRDPHARAAANVAVLHKQPFRLKCGDQRVHWVLRCIV